MMEAYTLDQIAYYAHQTEGMKLYSGGSSAKVQQEHAEFGGNWLAIHHVNTILPNNADGYQNAEDECEEIYGVIFDGDASFVAEDSSEESEMSQELIECETDSVDYAKPCLDERERDNVPTEDSAICDDMINESVKQVHFACAGDHADYQNKSQEINEVNSNATLNTKSKMNIKQPAYHANNTKTHNQTPSSSCDDSKWHSRRTSLDVIKKRMQVKQNRAAASIHAQYQRSKSESAPKNECVVTRPKLKFMAAPGVKDKRKKQLTLMGMFQK
jgi:hypothetical protein